MSSIANARIARYEWLWASVASVLVLLLSSVPVIAGYVGQTSEQIFGGAVYDRMDYNVRLAGIQTGLRGVWESQLLHTPERVPPSYVIIFYVTIGQVGRFLPLSPPVLYEVSRWVCGLWALLTMYAFAARFLRSVALRRAAYLFCALGSGLGWIMMLAGWQPVPLISPVDFWLIDLYGFFSILVFPHFSAVMALVWTTVLSVLNFWETGRARWLGMAVITSTLAQSVQPFAPLIADTALGGYALWKWLSHRRIENREWWSLTIFTVAQGPLLMYSASVFYGDPVWRIFSRQNSTPSPPPVYYLFGLSFPGLLAVIGAWCTVRRSWGEARLLIVWVVGVALLIYLPVQFQRRFTEGVIGPVAVLAAAGIGRGLLPALRRWDKLSMLLARVGYPYRRARALVLMLIIAAAMPSSLYLAFGGGLLAITRSPALFESADMVAAVDWLGANSDWQATVLSSERVGNFIPARIGHRVFCCHWAETMYYAQKKQLINEFFSTMSDRERWTLLKEYGVRYVFVGPEERKLGAYEPDSADYLRLRYRDGDTAIYEVASP
jgi:hypothetical protein